MGEDKSLLPFAGFSTLTEFQYSRLSKIFQNVYISCKDKNKFNFNANFIEDEKNLDTFAPTLGFVSAFKKLKEEMFFAISVDSPFISLQEIEKILFSDKTSYDASIAKTNAGIQPMCGVYHNSLESSFVKMLNQNNHKLGFLLKNSKTNYVYFEDEKPFLNLNHPHEYQEALTLI